MGMLKEVPENGSPVTSVTYKYERYPYETNMCRGAVLLYGGVQPFTFNSKLAWTLTPSLNVGLYIYDHWRSPAQGKGKN